MSRIIRTCAFAGIMTVLLVACGSSATAEDLEAVVAPLIEAHDDLQEFRFRIEGGLTYGQVLQDWPDVSASVRSAIDKVLAGDAKDLPDDDLQDLIAYAEDIAESHDRMLTVVQRVRDFIQDDAPERDISTALNLAFESMDRLNSSKSAALTPGS